MAIWAELKKVVNSDFTKPLNELIDEVKETTNKVYNSDTIETVYEPSDELIIDFMEGTPYTLYDAGTEAYIKKWTPQKSGILKLKTSFKVLNGNPSPRIQIRFYYCQSNDGAIKADNNYVTVETLNALSERSIVPTGALNGGYAYVLKNYTSADRPNVTIEQTDYVRVVKNVTLYCVVYATSISDSYPMVFEGVKIYGNEVVQ